MTRGDRSDYGKAFFSDRRQGSLNSAAQIVPLVLELVDAKSVVDVGCALGEWLSVFRQHGVRDYLGIDGDGVETSDLFIDEDRFQARDLAEGVALERRFDLAISIEVAEHLPETSAGIFVESLVRLAPVVLFSAAIPHQGGVGHVNMQWQSYWAELFERSGFVPIDCLRPTLWRNDEVHWWYRQNLLLYVSEDALADLPRLARARENTHRDQLDVVHPVAYLKKARRPTAVQHLAKLGRSIRKRMRRPLVR